MNSLFAAVCVGILAQYEPAIDLPIPPVPTSDVFAQPFCPRVVEVSPPTPEGCFATPGRCPNDEISEPQFCIKPIRIGAFLRGRAGHERPQFCIEPKGDLMQHHSPTSHGGYYYFRPYNSSHLPKQRSAATSFGVDSRTPYSNSVFRQVYETVEPRFRPRKN